MAEYKETAKAIIKNAIKSAIFIDENALEPYQRVCNSGVLEEKISVELYKEFLKSNVSLVNYRFKRRATKRNKSVLQNKDLVLLDWKLDSDTGEEMALDMINTIVSPQSHIPFCVVYTKEPQLDNVFDNILSYFSGNTRSECDDLRMDLLLEEEPNINEFMTQLSDLIHNADTFEANVKAFKQRFRQIFRNDYFAEEANLYDKLLGCWCAYSDYCKSETSVPRVSAYNSSNQLLMINETFIVVLSKQKTTVSDLSEKFSEVIAQFDDSFPQLLKLEMSGLIKEKGISLNADISAIKKGTFEYHKNQNSEEFENFIKNVLVEGISVNLLDTPLSIVESLNVGGNIQTPSNSELMRVNKFYNSAYRSNAKKLSFGDVFQLYENEQATDVYYVCISPLCDYEQPKNENTFYFAKGEKVDKNTIDKELKRSEEVFVNYVQDGTMVRWSKSADKGKPIYILPVPLTIPKLKITNGTIVAYMLKTTVTKKFKFQLRYITTLKSNYAQRIANHAFTHSTRVGISYVTKK